MPRTGMICAAMMVLATAGCATVDTASRNAVRVDLSATQAAPSMRLVDYEVRVPETLRVSEANLYYPQGDIVWRGEPMGDRYAQVKAIFDTSLGRAGRVVAGDLPVVARIEVKRFHAISEKARYTVGGVHSITFDLTFVDAGTGLPVVPTYEVRADLQGYGGKQAMLAEARGVTQKYRITRHLTDVLAQELAGSDTALLALAGPDAALR